MNLKDAQVRVAGKGLGKVYINNATMIYVQFSTGLVKYTYPDVVINKNLTFVDSVVQAAVDAELADLIAERQKAAAEKQAQLAQQKAQQPKTKVNPKTSTKNTKTTKRACATIKREPGKAATFLVFQGSTYDAESKGQFIWAPKLTKTGTTLHHWERLTDVEAGDVIFHCCDGEIKAISKALSGCEDSPRPDFAPGDGDFSEWDEDGRKVNCQYHYLKQPLKYGLYRDTLAQYSNVLYAPFNSEGNGNMGYLFALDKDLARFFMEKIEEQNPGIYKLDFIKFLNE